ncbi:hypothetical protein K466DRAFT_285684 [Polyporus arcularius HHB13444]|uniref:Cation/H+ exchanger transmembrane domain-containing protein n=1 Tax=Polyporus arcularius HHB13444 TaxID=1314778 RepID=A0A5C3NZH9_9APHY|nr:hypothetical protein K466DRAFT_285684 [Polyporus arcularius HHB13444]
MGLYLLQVTASGLVCLVIGGFVALFSLGSLLVQRKLYMNEVILGTACGVLFGPYGANMLNPHAWGDVNAVTLEVMRITLATGLFTIGVELPHSYLAEHARGLIVMVVPTMAFGWVTVACATYLTFVRLDFVSSLVIAACLTPTDPIISAAIVGGKYATEHVPPNLRRIIAAESASNDGLAYPFLSLSIYLTTRTSAGIALRDWILVGCLYQVVLGTAIGAMLGLTLSYLMKLSYRKGFISRESYLVQHLALTLFTVGITRTLGSDDLLAAFAAGSALNWDGYFRAQVEGEVFSTVIDLVLNCGTFVYIGAWMPFASFDSPELGITPWRLVLLFLAILCLRRVPALLFLDRWVPEISTWQEALFTGHFGPMGVGAIFTSSLALAQLSQSQSSPQGQVEILAATLQAIMAFMVLGSILVHGLSVPCFSLGRSVGARTLSFTKSLPLRNVSSSPDWLLWIHRASTVTLRAYSPATIEKDVERGAGQATGNVSTSLAPLRDLPKKIRIEQHTRSVMPLLAASQDSRSITEQSGSPLSVSEKASRVASPPQAATHGEDTRTANVRSPSGCDSTPSMKGADRSLHVGPPDESDDEDQDLAVACRLSPASPASLCAIGGAFPTPLDDDDLDLAAFVAELRGRTVRTASSVVYLSQPGLDGVARE